ncbi:hypothetical protein [Tichowtungia aerotolerans]|uniref:Uncharacterized protein n=1 Tax=Tichowtungia aerotolerans TaxID=2697043 RepID=A0A6P1MAC9_9BACT|nr:hypothetical protein [Tichowtungia aerotolerans]QHI70791.1 hypothetical protein GT409_15530 [Tichowtungia aerotolerans]
MRRVIVLITAWLCSLSVFAANNSFVPWAGDWNDTANWTLGSVPDDAGTYGNPVVVNGSKTCTIQAGTDATATRVFVGASAPGTLIVKGTLLYLWNTEGLQLGYWTAGHGTVKVLGGTIGAENNRKLLCLGTDNDDHGVLQIGDETVGGIGYFADVKVNSDTNGVSLIDLQGGELDADNVLLGDVQGTADSVKMLVSDAATVNVNTLLVGVKDYVTAAEMTVNGSEAQLNISSYVTLARDSRMNFVFDDNGVSTVSANKFWYDWNAEINITGTENVQSGTYELIVGATGGSMNQGMLKFNIDTNSFAAGTTLNLIHDTDGRDAVLLEVDSPVIPVTPEIGDITVDTEGSDAVVSFNGASGHSYALQRCLDLTDGIWSNIVTGITGAGGMQTVSNSMSPTASFYRIVSE